MTIHTRLSAIACAIMLAGAVQGCSTEIEDARLANRVRTTLSQDPVLAPGRSIDVAADSRGTVYLHGETSSRVASDRATQLASQVRGVNSVQNGITVGGGGP